MRRPSSTVEDAPHAAKKPDLLRDNELIYGRLLTVDEPHLIPIRYQLGLEGRHPDFPLLPGAEAVGTTEEAESADDIAAIRASNHQHPDHDTTDWVPRVSHV